MIAHAIAAWVAGVRRHPRLVLLVALALTALALWAAATRMTVSTDTSTMLDPDLPFQQQDRALKAAFPQLGGELVVVIDAVTAAQADRAAMRLTEALAARQDLFTFVSDLAGHPFFRRNGVLFLDLDAVHALTDRLAAAQPLLGPLAGDPSLRGLAGVMGTVADGLARQQGTAAALPGPLGPVLARMADTVEAQLAGQPARLDWQALLTPTGVEAGAETEAGTGSTAADAPARRLILASPKRTFEALSPAGAAMDAIRTTARALDLTPAHGITVRLTGAAAMENEELDSVQTGMDIAGAVTLVAVVSLLVLGLRAPRLILATVVTLVAGLCWTAGLAAVTVGTLNMISVAFAVLFIGLSVDFGIHFALRYREARRAGAANPAALEAAARGVGPALALCAAAAAIAFLSFLPTDYRGLAQLGLISGLGMGVAFVANLTLPPALLALWPVRVPRGASDGSGPADGAARLAGRLEQTLRRRARLVALGALGLAVAAAAVAPGARFDFDPINLRDPNTESVATLLDLLEDPQVTPYTIDILAEDLDTAEALAARVAALPEVAGAITARDLVPDHQDDKLAALSDAALFLGPALAQTPRPAPTGRAQAAARDALVAALDRLSGAIPEADRLARALRQAGDPAALDAVAAALTADLPALLERLRAMLEAGPVTRDDLPDALLRRYLAPDGQARVEVRPALDPRDPNQLARFVDAVRAAVPQATGTPVLIRESGRTVMQAFAEAAGLALVGITGLLAVTLRRGRDILLVYAPLGLAALLTVATAALAGLAFNFANVIVLPLLFGLGVASAIHLVQRERTEGTLGGTLASSTPRAVVFSALTTIGSFGAIALSSHPGTASMGVLLTIAIALTLVCTLGLLPALLALWPSRRR